MRRTRKSSRSDTAIAEIPQPEAIVTPLEITSEEPITVGVAADPSTDSGEDNAPRRRRRRSSAD
jgi:hypothetical protein